MEEIEHIAIDMAVPGEISMEKNIGIISVEGEDVAADELQNFIKKLDEVPGEPLKPRPVTIFRLPTWSHETNKDLCEPRIVSIGPYHRGKESLRPMEEHKWSTLRDFLARNTDVKLEDYFGEMRSLEASVRECYSEIVNLASNDFVMMLLLDGCFILEYLLKIAASQWDNCFVSWACGDIDSDLCLLENQMPFFVIHKLLATQGSCCPNSQGLCPLLELIHEVGPWPPALFHFRSPLISCSKIHHLLDLYYKKVLPDNQNQVEMEQRDLVNRKPHHCGLQTFPRSLIFPKSSSPVSQSHVSTKLLDNESMSRDINIACITELHEAGVKFRRKREPRDMFDISFQNGTIDMPRFRIGNNRKNFLWNMVAFEQTKPYYDGRILSSYLALMDSLINTEKDVAILERSSILVNYLKNDEEAATFFNQFGQIFIVDYSNHYYYGLYKDVKRYSESTWHKYRARLMHDYLNNPWSAVSVVAASILLILTFIQTIYSAIK